VTWPDPLLDDGAADDLSPSDACDLCFAWCVLDLAELDVPDPELPEPELPDPDFELELELDEPDEPEPEVLDAAVVVCVLPGSA
jgi:hypothetical protein